MDGRQADFEAVFALGGIWSELLGTAPQGIVGTEMLVRVFSGITAVSSAVIDGGRHREFEMFRAAVSGGSRSDLQRC